MGNPQTIKPSQLNLRYGFKSAIALEVIWGNPFVIQLGFTTTTGSAHFSNTNTVVFFGLPAVFSEAPDGIRLGEENDKKAS